MVTFDNAGGSIQSFSRLRYGAARALAERIGTRSLGATDFGLLCSVCLETVFEVPELPLWRLWRL